MGKDHYIEVSVDTPQEVCEQRDAKGLYAKARRGVMWTFCVSNLQFPGLHERTHMDQMQAAIEAAREG